MTSKDVLPLTSRFIHNQILDLHEVYFAFIIKKSVSLEDKDHDPNLFKTSMAVL